MNSENQQDLQAVAKELARGVASDPLTQSAGAVVANLGALWVAVLAQFWVFGSTALALAQFHNTLLVRRRIRSIPKALSIGVALLLVNYAALSLAVLAQFWVLFSTFLATVQFAALVRECWAVMFSRPRTD